MTGNTRYRARRRGDYCLLPPSCLLRLRRGGFTLMELMVVIIIVVILASSMIPIMSSASDARRCREGARLVSTMLSSAQTRAISSGRSAGVLFQPMKNNPYACMEMYLVEVPPPYSGDDAGYTARITYDKTSNTYFATILASGGGVPTFGGVPMSQNQANNQRLIRPGDIIKFNYRGQSYLLNYGDSNPYVLAVDANNTATMTITPTDPTGGYPAPTPPNSAGLPFQIFRQPLKTSDPPAQLADGAAVDWYFSGVDLVTTTPPAGSSPATVYPKSRIIFGALGTVAASSGSPPAPGPAAMATSLLYPATTCGPLIITFSSTGSVEQVYYSCCYPQTSGATPYFYQIRPLSAAYFLVGKIEKISPLFMGPIQNDPTNLPNYQDGDARWVSVTRQSGLITTTEMAKLQPRYANSGSNPPAFFLTGSSTFPTTIPEWTSVINAVINSRRYASGNQNSGGI